MIEAKRHYMLHSGGTKFYEAVQFTNVAAGRSACVFRWGKVSQRKNGEGQLKFEHGTPSQTNAAFSKKIAEKEKGGYSASGAAWGLHALASTRPDNRLELSDDTIRLMLANHYKLDDVDAIMSGLGTADPVGAMMNPADAEVIDESEPLPERSGDWGTW